MFDREIFLACECSDISHILRFSFFANEEDAYNQLIYIHVLLHPGNGFIKRLQLAFKYIFGYQSKYGHFNEVLLGKPQIEELKTFVFDWEMSYGDKTNSNEIGN